MMDANGIVLKVGDKVTHWKKGWNGHKPRLGEISHIVTHDVAGNPFPSPYVIVVEDPNNKRCTHTVKCRESDQVCKVT